MKLPTMIVPEITRDVETDMLVVGTEHQVKGNDIKQKYSHASLRHVVVVTEKPKAKSIYSTTTTTTTTSKLPKQLITPISIPPIKRSYQYNYTPSKPSSLRKSTISPPPKPLKPKHLCGTPILSPLQHALPSRPSSPSLKYHQSRQRLFTRLHNAMLKTLITLKIQEDMLDRKRAQERRDREAWERYVLDEADDREMAIGRGRLRMMSVWLDLKCLTTEGQGFVFECGATGEERDEFLQREDARWDEDDEEVVVKEDLGQLEATSWVEAGTWW